MIEKLESAGLGFCMKPKEMLGIKVIIIIIFLLYFWVIVTASSGIPLRHLVYRVHDLPPSMKSLVYDFGELNDDAEGEYISEIVNKHVSNLTPPLIIMHFYLPFWYCFVATGHA